MPLSKEGRDFFSRAGMRFSKAAIFESNLVDQNIKFTVDTFFEVFAILLVVI